MISVNVYNESGLARLPKKLITSIVSTVCSEEKITVADIRIILVTDEEIHRINKQYLQHDYPTDVITFQIEAKPLEGEIYISADTALLQAKEYNVTISNEILRLSVHGILHLAGYDDDTSEKRLMMSNLESKYLNEIK
ncbi:MAG: rRNA maturation RNase YbeY [Ignavibacteria bacterium]|nr:rRNA maturation RNase YbeY [Ignavibacteria bacterium]